MVQEMGGCGRGRFSTIGSSVDIMNLCLSLDDYVHLNQRFYPPAPKTPSHAVCILFQVEVIDL